MLESQKYGVLEVITCSGYVPETDPVSSLFSEDVGTHGLEGEYPKSESRVFRLHPIILIPRAPKQN